LALRPLVKPSGPSAIIRISAFSGHVDLIAKAVEQPRLFDKEADVINRAGLRRQH
jgi:hypothetical protein